MPAEASFSFGDKYPLFVRISYRLSCLIIKPANLASKSAVGLTVGLFLQGGAGDADKLHSASRSLLVSTNCGNRRIYVLMLSLATFLAGFCGSEPET